MNREAITRTLDTLRTQAHADYDHERWTHWCGSPACLAAWVCIANGCTIEPSATDDTLRVFTRVPGHKTLVHVRMAARTILGVSDETAQYLFDEVEVLCDETGDIFQPDVADALALLERALASGRWRWVRVPHPAPPSNRDRPSRNRACRKASQPMSSTATQPPRTLADLARAALAATARARRAQAEGAHIMPTSDAWWHYQDEGPAGEPATFEISLEGMVIDTLMDQGVFDHPGHHVEPDDTTGRWPQCILALDHLTRGEWEDAARPMHGNPHTATRFADVMRHEIDGAVPEDTRYYGWAKFEEFVHDFEDRIAPAIERAETTR